jgi:hypothetical protein
MQIEGRKTEDQTAIEALDDDEEQDIQPPKKRQKKNPEADVQYQQMAAPRRRSDMGGGTKRQDNWSRVKKSIANFKKAKRGNTSQKGQMSVVKADI